MIVEKDEEVFESVGGLFIAVYCSYVWHEYRNVKYLTLQVEM